MSKERELTVEALVEILGIMIPRSWAESRDPAGLQAGDPNRKVGKIWPVPWVTREVLRRAQRRNVDLLISYRPLSANLQGPLDTARIERELLRLLFRSDVSLYCVASSIHPHPLGPSRILAERLGLSSIHPVLPKPNRGLAKIVTFVPEDHTSRVRSAMAEAGAGRIGEYEICSFRLTGEGSFRGSERARPFIGEAGFLEFAAEDRLEMVCPVESVPEVVTALGKTHPYEEPAYDIYTLHDVSDPRQTVWIGELEKPVSSEDLHEKVATAFPNASPPQSVGHNRVRRIRRIACTAFDGSEVVSHLPNTGVQAFLCRGVDDRGAWELTERGVFSLSLSRHVLDDLFPASIRWILEQWKKAIKIV